MQVMERKERVRGRCPDAEGWMRGLLGCAEEETRLQEAREELKTGKKMKLKQTN